MMWHLDVLGSLDATFVVSKFSIIALYSVRGRRRDWSAKSAGTLPVMWEQSPATSSRSSFPLYYMSDPIFVKTRYHYDPYVDFWDLVALSKFQSVYVDEMDLYDSEKLYMVSPHNGELEDFMKDK